MKFYVYGGVVLFIIGNMIVVSVVRMFVKRYLWSCRGVYGGINKKCENVL